MDATSAVEGQLVLISDRLLGDDTRDPGFVAFDPDDAGMTVAGGRTASGWELYAGDESDAELEDIDRVHVTELEWALERYPTLASLVATHDGTAGAWLAEGTGWVAVED
ncbi:hypothetical protein [Nitriliruptor alkaliphilus]|uniref:hypothetical protein n=1 Tax=Nitriliruptor alkaliphilus TaxID=427918 RepID=UPI0006990982|nr:hypothetical protein [Nitriliruptor alkaliphilus]